MEDKAFNPRELERTIVERALRDTQFRKSLLANPLEALASNLGVRLPAGVQIKAIEQEPGTLYVVLPFTSPRAGGIGELSEAELVNVSGGPSGACVQTSI